MVNGKVKDLHLDKDYIEVMEYNAVKNKYKKKQQTTEFISTLIFPLLGLSTIKKTKIHIRLGY